jgi:hypothetical protein
MNCNLSATTCTVDATVVGGVIVYHHDYHITAGIC